MNPAGPYGLSIIVPTLNEGATLPHLLGDLQRQCDIKLDIIIADGGSSDATLDLAAAHGCQIVNAPRGRGRQMNAGVRAATAPWLLFMHADSRLHNATLLREALSAIRDRGDDTTAGHFPLRFERSVAGHEHLFRFLEAKTASNRPLTINGDQGLLISRRYFDLLGGYDERLPFLEDQRIAARIFASGRWMVLPGELTTSARRFEQEGHTPRYLLMGVIMAMHSAEFDAFFAAAPAVYAAQPEAQPLQLAPFRRLILRLLREQGVRRSSRLFYRTGQLVRRNLWQAALWRDLGRDDSSQRDLRRYDRYLAPLLANPVADLIAASLTTLWFFGVLPLRRGL